MTFSIVVLVMLRYFVTVTLKVPLPGSSDPVKAAIRYLTVTVLVALTHAENEPVAVWLALGTPRLTTSPSAAPVTVMVKSVLAPAAVLPKSRVAKTFNPANATSQFVLPVPVLLI